MEEKLRLLGCGILKKEVKYLIEKNHWPMDTVFLDSSLHIDFDKLSRGLQGSLAKHRDGHNIVFYGCCHPLMDRMLEAEHTFRTEGQNCVDILLGHELFDAELEKGAFFLLEDWARRWDSIEHKTYGVALKPGLVREIMAEGGRTYLLALKTPCSADFTAEAEAIAARLQLPLYWLEVGLEHLEAVLRAALERKLMERP
jgi:hypothetical protein